MKYISFLIFCFIVHIHLFGQSKYGFQVGVDSIAINFSIKTKVETEIIYLENDIDTIINKTYYDTNGYIIEYNKYESFNKEISNNSPFNCFNIEFEYNNRGYLINEKLNCWINDGTSFGKDTINSTIVETWKYIDTYQLLVSKSETIFNINNTNTSKKCYLNYLDDGRIHTEECVFTTNDIYNYSESKIYSYLESTLLSEITISNSKKIVSKKTYQYVYFTK